MKENFQINLENILNEITKEGVIKRLLLHSCCGPCSSYCLDYLKDYFDITVFYYNPSIYPEEEYRHRLREQSKLINKMNEKMTGTGKKIKLIEGPYEHKKYLEFVQGLEGEPEGGARCEKCFEQRLSVTAELAKKSGFDYFGTTLTVSPHKNAVLINKIGNELEKASAVFSYDNLEITENNFFGVLPQWLPSDFKKREGYKKSIELSKEYDLYRQDYCGCEFSIRQNCPTSGNI